MKYAFLFLIVLTFIGCSNKQKTQKPDCNESSCSVKQEDHNDH